MSLAKKTPSKEKEPLLAGEMGFVRASAGVACTPSTGSSSSHSPSEENIFYNRLLMTTKPGANSSDSTAKQTTTPPSSGPSKKTSTAGSGSEPEAKAAMEKDEKSRIAAVHEQGYADTPTVKSLFAFPATEPKVAALRFGSAATVPVPSTMAAPAATTAVKRMPTYNGGEMDDDDPLDIIAIRAALQPLSLGSRVLNWPGVTGEKAAPPPMAHTVIPHQQLPLSKNVSRVYDWNSPSVKKAFEEVNPGPANAPPGFQGPVTRGGVGLTNNHPWRPVRQPLTMVINNSPTYAAITSSQPSHAGMNNNSNPIGTTVAPPTGPRPAVVDVPDRYSRGPRQYQPMDVAINPEARNEPITEEKKRDNLARGFSIGYRGNTALSQNRSADIPPEANCGLYVTGLPADATNKLVVDSIRGCGRVWCTHVVPPNPRTGHAFAAAKIVFFDRAGAERFMAKHAGYDNWELRYQPPLPGDEIGDGSLLHRHRGLDNNNNNSNNNNSWVGSPQAEPFVPGATWGRENMAPTATASIVGGGDSTTTGSHAPNTPWNLTSPIKPYFFSGSPSRNRVQFGPGQYPPQAGFGRLQQQQQQQQQYQYQHQHEHQHQNQQDLYAAQLNQHEHFHEDRPPIHAVWNRIRYAADRRGNNERTRVLLISGDPEFVNPRSLHEYLSARIEFQTESVRVVKVVQVPVAPSSGAGAGIGRGGGGVNNRNNNNNNNGSGSTTGGTTGTTGTPATVFRQLVEFRFCSFRCQADAAKMCLEGEHPNKVLVHYGRDPCDVETPEQALEDGRY